MSIETINLKFLTPELAQDVITNEIVPIFNNIPNKSRNDGYLIAIVPRLIRDTEVAFPECYKIVPAVLYDHYFTPRSKWSDNIPFDEIAQCKTLQMWQGRNFPNNMASLGFMLFEGDTPYYGAHSESLLTVGFSGIQAYNDQRRIAKTTVDALIARCEYEKQLWIEHNPGKHFV